MLAATSLLALAPARAQPPARPSVPERVLTPAAARVDADGDFVPDRLGQTVRVGGRASRADAGSGALNAAIESGGAGLAFRAERVRAPLAEGDSVIARGVVRQGDGGETYLDATAYAVVPGARRPPRSRKLSLRSPLEPFEGTLVTLEGTAFGLRRIGPGQTINLVVEDSLLYAIGFADSEARAAFDGLKSGQRVRVTGVLSQFDRVPPFASGYQIIPRSGRDVEAVGMSPAATKAAAIAGALLVVLGFLTALYFSRQARRGLEARLQSEQRFRILYEHAAEAIFLHAVEPGGTRLLDCNDEAARVLGYTKDDLRALDPWTLAVDAEGTERLRRQLAAEGRAEARVRLRHRDGHEVPFDVRAYLAEDDGRTFTLSLASDVTQRLAYERGLIDARERAEAYATLQASFVANMSHEIRTPLAGIIGFAEVLREELSGQHRHFAGLIEAGGRRLLDTLNAILDLARLDAKGVPFHAAPADLAVEVRQAVALVRPLAARKRIDLDLDLPDALPARVDAGALGQVLFNLIGNAIKFTPAGGRVAVRARADADAAEIAVSDTGIGISEAFLPHLFEPFTQESVGYDRTHEGTGLGLSITQRLVALMGGTITVSTAREGAGGTPSGTTFAVRLPLGGPEGGPDRISGAVPVAEEAATA